MSLTRALRQALSKTTSASFSSDNVDAKQKLLYEDYGVVQRTPSSRIFTVYPRKQLQSGGLIDRRVRFLVGNSPQFYNFQEAKEAFESGTAPVGFPFFNAGNNARQELTWYKFNKDGTRTALRAAVYENGILSIEGDIYAKYIPETNSFYIFEKKPPTGKGLVPPPPAAAAPPPAATAPAPASDEPARWFERQDDLPSVFMDSSGAGNQFAPAPGLVYKDGAASKVVMNDGTERMIHPDDIVWGNKSHTPLHPGPPAWQRASVASVEHVLRRQLGKKDDVAMRRFAARRIYGLYTLHASAELMGFGECVPKVVEKLQPQNVGS